jgi:mannosyltransferase OCH1-like enzyme
MIPKIIHQMWIGPKPAPMKMIQTWIDKNPEWQHILWTNDLVKEKYPNGFKNQKHIDEHETWNGKCDIMRYEILHEYGGFFIDADAICINSLDDHFLEHDSFSCFENEELRGQLVACGYMGVIKECKLMELCTEDLYNTPDLKEKTTGLMSWQTVGPLFFTNEIIKHQYPISVYPSYVFIPNHYTGKSYTGTGKSYADQKWGSTFGYENI